MSATEPPPAQIATAADLDRLWHNCQSHFTGGRDASGHTLGPDEWEQATAPQEGSWWPDWNAWLSRHSGPLVPPLRVGLPGVPPLAEVPSTYVLQG